MKLVSSAGRFPLVAVALPAMAESVRARRLRGFRRERCLVVGATYRHPAGGILARNPQGLATKIDEMVTADSCDRFHFPSGIRREYQPAFGISGRVGASRGRRGSGLARSRTPLSRRSRAAWRGR